MQKYDEKKGVAIKGMAFLVPERPVDVEFESALQKLAASLRGLIARAASYRSQMEFFKTLRATRLIFKHKILRFYGNRYRGGKCGRLLLTLAEKGTHACQISRKSSPQICGLLKSYVAEIRLLQKQ